MKIEVKNVSKSFKDNLVLKDVNMTLEGGHIYGFTGRNGSGKSVLLKLLCGFYKADNGTILFDGEDIVARGMFAKDTRVLIEQPFFVGDLSGFENLRLLARIQNKIDDEKIIQTLKDVNLYEQKDKRYHKYSLGMKQKLGIAQVLMEDEEFLILDEPFNAIESESVDKIKGILKREKEKGKIIIIASHIKEDIEQLADTIYHFENSMVTKVS